MKPGGKAGAGSKGGIPSPAEGGRSHVRRLERVPPARVINVMYRYRLLSLDESRTWVLLNHNEYVKRIRRCYR
ncbi:hypothetical protein ACV8W7_000998 [Shigella sonnei]